jgi:homoserine dehydrogenase
MKTCKVLLLGYGVAGKAFARILNKTHGGILAEKGIDVKVVGITTGSRGCLYCADGIDLAEATRQLEEEGKFDPGRQDYCETDSLTAAKEWEYDVLMELTPLNIFTGQPATEHIKAALTRGKHAASANKGPLAWHYAELRDLAKQNGCGFFFETTVMAGTPTFNMADHCLQFCEISRIEGILNATTNYILKEMGKGVPIDDIMRSGREQGFLEADPSMDTEGWDASAKLTVLMNVLMDAGLTPDKIDRTGISGVTADDIEAAKSRGNVIKLMCRGTKDADGKITATVRPEEIPANDVFAGEDLAAVYSLYTDLMGKLTFLQYGLETTQTGYGVFADLCRVLDFMNGERA